MRQCHMFVSVSLSVGRVEMSIVLIIQLHMYLSQLCKTWHACSPISKAATVLVANITGVAGWKPAKHDQHVCTYVHRKNRSAIHSLALIRLAIKPIIWKLLVAAGF